MSFFNTVIDTLLQSWNVCMCKVVLFQCMGEILAKDTLLIPGTETICSLDESPLLWMILK